IPGIQRDPIRVFLLGGARRCLRRPVIFRWKSASTQAKKSSKGYPREVSEYERSHHSPLTSDHSPSRHRSVASSAPVALVVVDRAGSRGTIGGVTHRFRPSVIGGCTFPIFAALCRFLRGW